MKKNGLIAGIASTILASFIACGSALAQDMRYMPIGYPEAGDRVNTIMKEPVIDYRGEQRADLKSHPVNGIIPIFITKQFQDGTIHPERTQLLAKFDYRTNTFEVDGTLLETTSTSGPHYDFRKWGTVVKGHIVGGKLGVTDRRAPSPRLVIDEIDMKSSDKLAYHPQDPSNTEVGRFFMHVLSKEVFVIANLDARADMMKTSGAIPSQVSGSTRVYQNNF